MVLSAKFGGRKFNVEGGMWWLRYSPKSQCDKITGAVSRKWGRISRCENSPVEPCTVRSQPRLTRQGFASLRTNATKAVRGSQKNLRNLIRQAIDGCDGTQEAHFCIASRPAVVYRTTHCGDFSAQHGSEKKAEMAVLATVPVSGSLIRLYLALAIPEN